MRILVVEDSERLRRSLSQGLARSGYAVDAAADGRQALEHLTSYDYDVVILDLMLPEVPGVEVLRRARGRPRRSRSGPVGQGPDPGPGGRPRTGRGRARTNGRHAGLGLALVRTLTRVLGYEVNAELDPGQIVTLTVSGPRRPPSPQPILSFDA